MDLCLDRIITPWHRRKTIIVDVGDAERTLTIFVQPTPGGRDVEARFTNLENFDGSIVVVKHGEPNRRVFQDIRDSEANQILRRVLQL